MQLLTCDSLQILTLYAQRPIVEKHTRYAFYHASAEAFASMLTDMPYKILNAILFNVGKLPSTTSNDVLRDW